MKNGCVPEWPNGADCKSAVFDFGGSNPSAPTALALRLHTTRDLVARMNFRLALRFPQSKQPTAWFPLGTPKGGVMPEVARVLMQAAEIAQSIEH